MTDKKELRTEEMSQVNGGGFFSNLWKKVKQSQTTDNKVEISRAPQIPPII